MHGPLSYGADIFNIRTCTEVLKAMIALWIYLSGLQVLMTVGMSLMYFKAIKMTSQSKHSNSRRNNLALFFVSHWTGTASQCKYMVSWEVFMWAVLCCDSVQNSSLARGDVRQSSCSSFLPSSCSSTKPYGKLSLIFIKLFVVLIVEWTGKCTFFELRSRYIIASQLGDVNGPSQIPGSM